MCAMLIYEIEVAIGGAGENQRVIELGDLFQRWNTSVRVFDHRELGWHSVPGAPLAQ